MISSYLFQWVWNIWVYIIGPIFSDDLFSYQFYVPDKKNLTIIFFAHILSSIQINWTSKSHFITISNRLVLLVFHKKEI
jgi:hypothetical protein